MHGGTTAAFAAAVAVAAAAACSAFSTPDAPTTPLGGDGGAEASVGVLAVTADPTLTIARKGSGELHVTVARPSGIDGAAHLTVEGLPPAIAATSVDVATGAFMATVVLTAGEGALQGSAKPTIRATVGDKTAAAAFALVVNGAPGDLDTSFGDGGITGATMGEDDSPEAVAVQPDGRILVAGYTAIGNQFDTAVARFTPEGALDTTFASTGMLRYDLLLKQSDGAESVALQPDGKILLAGWIESSMAVVRLDPDGSRDPSFGAGGLVQVTIGANDHASAAVLRPDGLIFIAGGGSGAALDADGGQLVTGFADAGKLTFPADASVTSAVGLRDGGFVASGLSNASVVGIGLRANGAVDSTFGDAGVATVVPPSFASPVALARQADGKLVFATSRYVTNVGYHFVVGRVSENGAPDTFGDTNFAEIAVGVASSIVYGVAVQSDGKIVVVGSSQIEVGSGIDAIAMIRLDGAGSLDPTFGNGGKVFTLLPKDDHVVHAVALAPDGKIVVAAARVDDTSAHFEVFRYWP